MPEAQAPNKLDGDIDARGTGLEKFDVDIDARGTGLEQIGRGYRFQKHWPRTNWAWI